MEMYNMPPREGWQCPVCGRVYSPIITMCYYCGNETTSTTTTTTMREATEEERKGVRDYIDSISVSPSTFRFNVENETVEYNMFDGDITWKEKS